MFRELIGLLFPATKNKGLAVLPPPKRDLQKEAEEIWEQIRNGDVGLIPYYHDSVAGFENSEYIKPVDQKLMERK